MSRKLQDLTGQRFGKLLVIRRQGFVQRNTKQPTWLCQCDCGQVSVVMGANLRNGNTKSCGCVQRAYRQSGDSNRVHGLTKTPTHNSWRAMRERCDNPNNSHYPSYGGRGISYPPAWEDFRVFLFDMGLRPPGTTLERMDNNEGYGIENCFWATPAQQSRNTSRSVKLTWEGETLNQVDWARRIGLTSRALAIRIKRWGLEKAMTAAKYAKH